MERGQGDGGQHGSLRGSLEVELQLCACGLPVAVVLSAPGGRLVAVGVLSLGTEDRRRGTSLMTYFRSLFSYNKPLNFPLRNIFVSEVGFPKFY